MPSIAFPSFKVLLEFAMHLLFLLQAAPAGMKTSLNRKSNHQKQIRLLTVLHPVTILKQKEFRNQGSSRKPSTSVPFCASACWWYCPLFHAVLRPAAVLSFPKGRFFCKTYILYTSIISCVFPAKISLLPRSVRSESSPHSPERSEIRASRSWHPYTSSVS